MITVNKLLPRGQSLSAVLLKRAATIELDWEIRQKSRFQGQDSQGRAIGVFLPRGTVVRDGDVLVAEDGSLIKVSAAPQDVMIVTAQAQTGQPFDLMRAAYHLGNRHVALQLTPEALILEPDHVLADMLRMMGLTVTSAQAPFDPESGAYASGQGAHHHGHSHDHHDHAHEHTHDGHCCDHGHHHAHDHPESAPVHQPISRGKPIPIPVKASPAATSCCDHHHHHDDEHNTHKP